jgi:hypothetical protein
MNLDEFKENVAPSLKVNDNGDVAQKRKDCRFEFALYANEYLVCKRNFSINGYIEGSMVTENFKNKVDEIVEIINDDLKAKTRTYLWYHNFPENPEWDPEVMTDPLIDEGQFVLRFAVSDNGKEVISKTLDARYYPNYIRNNIDITNKLVKLTKGENTYVYNRDRFFGDNDSPLSGDLYVLKHMISEREDLIPIIQKIIYEVCSSYDGYFDSISQYNTVLEYKTTKVRKTKNGEVVTKNKTYINAEGKECFEYNHDGTIKQVPVYDTIKGGTKTYHTNIAWYNRKVERGWAEATKEKTDKYFDDLYHRKKKEK